MRALIVDDEKNIRRTLLLALESTGHDAMAVASGPLAIEELKSNAPRAFRHRSIKSNSEWTPRGVSCAKRKRA